MDDKKSEPQEGVGLGINIEPKEEEIDVQSIKTQEEIQELLDEQPETFEDGEEEKELTDEEKKELYIQQLKDSKKVFHPIKHDGNITTNQFDVKFKQHRKRKNTLAKQSRRANRRK